MLKFHWDKVNSPEFVEWAQGLANNTLQQVESLVFSKVQEKLAEAPKIPGEENNNQLVLSNFVTISPLGNLAISNLNFASAVPQVSILNVESLTIDDIRNYFSQPQSYQPNSSNNSEVTPSSSTTPQPSQPSQPLEPSQDEDFSDCAPSPQSSFDFRSFSDSSEERSIIRGPEHADDVPSLLDESTLSYMAATASGNSFSEPLSSTLGSSHATTTGTTTSDDIAITLRVAYHGAATGTFSAAFQLGLPKFLAADPTAPAKPFASMPFDVHLYGMALAVDIRVLVLRSEQARVIASEAKSLNASLDTNAIIAGSGSSDAALNLFNTSIPALSKLSLSSIDESSQLNESINVANPDRLATGSEIDLAPLRVCPQGSATPTVPSVSSLSSYSVEATPTTGRKRRPISGFSGISTPFSSPSNPLLSASRPQQPIGEIKTTEISEDSGKPDETSTSVRGSSLPGSAFREGVQRSLASQPTPATPNTLTKLPLVFLSITKGPLAPLDRNHFEHPDYLRSLSHIPALSTPALRASHLYDLPHGDLVRRIGLCITFGQADAATRGGIFQHDLQAVEKFLLATISKIMNSTLVYPTILPVKLIPSSSTSISEDSRN